MARRKKEEVKLSFETEEEFQDDNRLNLHPEAMVKLREDNNGFPAEFCPYGEDYLIEKARFLSDEPPCEQFAEDGHRLWEVINDGDEDLIPVYFSMPTPPKDLTLIDGYGLDRDNQYFKRLEIPRKFRQIETFALKSLYDIEKRNRQDTVQGYKYYLKFWEIIEEEKDKLVDEILWLKRVWWWRTYGYWFYNDGEPTYIPPDYFDFLNFYYIAEAECYPEYRDDVRRKFCFAWYLENCTETFKDLDETGRARKNAEGKYEMLDLGRRLFFGDCEPKTRRTGATHEAIHKILKGAMTHLSYFSTIISFEGNNAEVHYRKKLLPAFDAYPMVLKPMWEGNRRPTVLRLDAPPNIYHIQGLRSAITFSDSGGIFKNEGDRLNGVLNDEQGKDSNLKVDIFERWHVNKFTMSTGMGINILKGAYVKNPSTVEQMESSSAPYYKLCMMSNFYHRIPGKGQTPEGFARIFLPAYLRMEGYIDRFGKSVIENPTERQIRLSPYAIFAVSGKGAKEMLQAERDILLADGSPQAMESYRSIRRKSPFKWSECWLGASGNVGFNLEIIDRRLNEINKMKSFGKPPYRRGYFYRENGDIDGKVIWKDDSEKVKFILSYMPPEKLTNQRQRCDIWDAIKGVFVPAWQPVHGHRFTCGADPFRNITKTEAKVGALLSGSMSNSRQSDGGIGINWEYDESIDKGRPRHEWETDRCVLSYRYRPSTQEEYFEDILMAIQFFGSMLYPEHNVERLVEYVIKRGYGGYFLYDIDALTGRPKAMPGRYTTAETQQDIMAEMKDYIEFRGHKCCHDDLLTELKNCRGTEDLTHRDLMVAYAYARLGSKSRHREIISNSTNVSSFDVSSVPLFRKRYI